MTPDRYFVLAEPSLDETVERPGLLFVLRDGGAAVERLLPDGSWRDAPSLIAYLVGEETGAVEIPQDVAKALIASVPWAEMRI